MKRIILTISLLLFSVPQIMAADGLFYMASQGDTDGIKRYKISGGDLHLKDRFGNSALLLASENGYTSLVSYLLANGVDVNSMNKYGYTPLFAAVANAHGDTITALMKAGANPNLKNQYNSSALDYVRSLNFDSIDQYAAYLKSPDSKLSHAKGPNSFFYIKPWQQRADKYLDQNKLDMAAGTLKKAAANGDPDAQYLLGMLYIENGMLGEGIALLTSAADSGHVEAMYKLGVYYTQGYDPINPVKGFNYLKRAADAGHTGAIAETGKCYLLGIGVLYDPSAAKTYLDKAIELGEPTGLYYTGVMHYYGLGVEADTELGLSQITMAASSGYIEAQRQLDRFATEDALSYLADINRLDRPTVKAYMLSQGATLTAEAIECDSFNVADFFDYDYGIHDVTSCFPPEKPSNMVFKIRPDIYSVYKEVLIRYEQKAPVSYVIMDSK